MLFSSKLALNRFFKKTHQELCLKDVANARKYIRGYWKNLERYHPKDDKTLLGLPNPYLVPAYEEGSAFDFNEMYYWDSYFMAQGLLDKEHKKLILGILENLIYMQKRFRIIPNASRTYLMGRSQPPFLTSFIFDVYDSYNMSLDWLKTAMDCALNEYETVWTGVSKPNERKVYKNLSRYYDINYLHDLAEAESGWDMTPRFDRKALNYLPIDLNSLLYKYELDFAKLAKLLKNSKEEQLWLKRASLRKNTVNELMWNKTRGFYFDYDFKRQKRGNVSSLAGFYPMWAGLASDEQASKMVKYLTRFEEAGGLATTDSQNLNVKNIVPGAMPTQWAHPNGWAPLHFIVIKGLENYGYHQKAKALAHKWLRTNLDWFNHHGVFLEKYNVVDISKPPAKGLYPCQVGFGWTNAIFERFCKDYIDD